MQIFRYRYTCIILSLFLAGCLIGYLANSYVRYVLLGVFAVAAIASASLRRFIKGKARIIYSKKISIVASLSLIAFFLAILCSTVFYDLSFSEIKKEYGKENSFTLEICDISYNETYGAAFTAKIRKCNEKEIYPNHKVEVKTDYGLDAEEGDIISCVATVSGVSSTSVDDERQSHADGIFIVCKKISDIRIVGHSNSLSYFMKDLRADISEYIESNVKGDSAELIKSLLIGERKNLDPSVKLSFRRLGISHILALSGLHLSVITFGLEFLLKRIRVHKTARFAIELLFVIFYAALTGFSVSVIRAAIMLGAVAITYFFWTDYDSITSLLISGFLICLFMPYSIIDVSFLLSFFATFGVIVYVEFVEMVKRENRCPSQKPKFFRRMLIYIRDSFFISAFSSMMTFVILLLFFDSFSIFAPFFNLFICPLFVAYIYLTVFSLPLLNFTPIAKLCGFLGDLLIDLSKRLSDIKGILQSSQSSAARIFIIIAVAVMFVAVFGNFKKPRRIAAVMIASFTLLTVGFSLSHISFVSEDAIIYQRSEENEQIILLCDGRVTVCDISDGYSDTLYAFADGMAKSSVTEIDTYALTHYHLSHINFIANMVSVIKTHEILLPIPQDEYEEAVYRGIVSVADREDIAVTLYNDNERICRGSSEISLIYRSSVDSSSHGAFAMSFKTNENELLYVSDMLHSARVIHKNVIYEMEVAENIFFGTHGPEYDGSEIPYDAYSPSLRILSYSDDGVAFFAPQTGSHLVKAKRFLLPNYYRIEK